MLANEAIEGMRESRSKFILENRELILINMVDVWSRLMTGPLNSAINSFLLRGSGSNSPLLRYTLKRIGRAERAAA